MFSPHVATYPNGYACPKDAVLLSAGDAGSARCDQTSSEVAAQYGLAVSGLASTPFNVAVGGTDFSDVNNWSQYWNSTNSSPSLSVDDNASNSPQTASLTGTGVLPPTSPGSYSVQVQAVSGSIEHMVKVSVTVQ